MTENDGFAIGPAISAATRTLTAAGFVITDFRRQPYHGEFICERIDLLGMSVPYLIVVSERDEPHDDDLVYATRDARENGRTLVVVTNRGSKQSISWEQFVEALGGAVPTWRALGATYPDVLRTTARNEVPAEMTGEGWRLFEQAVADGFEFILGRRVRRLGGGLRGQRVSDMITQTPDLRVLVLDAKAAKSCYDVGAPELRPLNEYVRTQRDRQRGRLNVAGALIVANCFEQPAERLALLSAEFLADTGVPMAFLEVDTLLEMIRSLTNAPLARNTLRWSQIFCRGGLVNPEVFRSELRAATRETYPR